MPGNKPEVRCYMAYHMGWHQSVQDWLRFLLLENEVGNIAKTAT